MHPINQLRAKLDAVRKASEMAEVKAPPPPQAVKLTEAAAELPEHIRLVTDAPKLNAQTPFFKCPAWADLPSRAYHLFATRDGIPFPALDLQRFPFYLLGKSSACDYVLEHPSISSVHAAIVFHKAQNCFVLVDLGSTNGSRVNGKVVEARKPVPLPVGAVLHFGYSSRQYTVCAGPPPSSKRLREEQDQVLEARRRLEAEKAASKNAIPPAAVPAATATSSLSGPSAEPDSTNQRTSGIEPTQTPSSTHHTEKAAPEAEAAPPVASASPATADAPSETVAAEPKRMHLFQLVIKHKDVKNPVSRGRNKGEVITRSAADARQVAQFILHQHDQSHQTSNEPGQSATGHRGGFVPWTVEAFTEAVLEYCEMSNPKKKGDLGVVEEGTFAPAFDQAAFALRRHEVSQPVETELGIHLIYRCD